jgi:hypothetical protein
MGFPRQVEHRLSRQRLVALFLFGCALFNYPLLAIVNHSGNWFGFPPLYAWLMGAWLVFIILLAWTAEGRGG